jgi:D-alanyl-D-alanine carboxypeptidase/D-alanyl-D-alanine-endopeptidase (penicillin-binding protein 4)
MAHHALTRPRRLAAAGAALAATAALGATALAPAAGATPTTAGATAARTTAVTAYGRTAADARISAMLAARVTTTRFGTAFSGAVVDASSNAVVWSKRGTTAYLPASTTKLVTAANVLSRLGPSARFTTRLRGGSQADQVVVVGRGDPSLTSASLDAMARSTASALRGRGLRSARVYVDDSVFPAPTLAYGWKSSYVPDAITPVRGLVRDQRDVWDTSADVGRYVRDRLTTYGVSATYMGRARASATSRVYASSTGDTVAAMASRMLLHSDNEIAEALHKQVGISRGTGATWTGARTAQSRQMAAQGLTLTALYDGSGLSRADRLTALQLARLVDRGVDTAYPALWPMRSAQAMPTAGRTGTLRAEYGRFVTAESRCAAGRVWAKTGTLSDVVALAGFTKGTDGRVKVFAFVVNGRTSSLALKQGVDMLAATVNGCH